LRDAESLERKSTENLIEVYRQELLRMIEGESCVSLLTVGVRRRLKKEGILLKSGNRYIVSPRGRAILEPKDGTN